MKLIAQTRQVPQTKYAIGARQLIHGALNLDAFSLFAYL
jgi:hypothetical protein